jgi:hypothetical protein
MYAEHADCEFPSNLDAHLWRYMDLTKLIAVLKSKTLWYTRSDLFDDRYEGAYTRSSFKVSGSAWLELERRRRMGEEPDYA